MKILVVDDEPVQLETICRGLRLYGHHCLQAINGTAALEVLAGPEGASVELLLTDLTMPDTTGYQLIQEVTRTRPGLPIVVFTGLHSSPDLGAVREGGIPVLQKPFGPDALMNIIRKLCPSCCD